jgi:hypothetical protein
MKMLRDEQKAQVPQSGIPIHRKDATQQKLNIVFWPGSQKKISTLFFQSALFMDR